MTPRTLKEWIEAMKLCRDNDIAFSVSGPGLVEMINTLEEVNAKLPENRYVKKELLSNRKG